MNTKSRQKKNLGISPERLAELRHATLIASTGSSLRLSGSKVTNEQVEQIMYAISKSSGQK
ncbi:MAG: hypothetical protein HYT62_03200 [Candidatus Yanofskybacteria bacterium]|nr:hypothetical protein [Candidatus Yanofskybacteria bacterium]